MSEREQRITIDPDICHGKPTVRGLRYPVEAILELLSSGMSTEQILADYPDLERDDVLACLAFAAQLLRVKRIDLARRMTFLDLTRGLLLKMRRKSDTLGSAQVSSLNGVEHEHESSVAWLKDPAEIDAAPFAMEQDWDIVFAGTLDGGIVGHMRFYLEEDIPNPAKKEFLLNAIYIVAWGELIVLYPKRGYGQHPSEVRDLAEKELEQALQFADCSGNLHLSRWAVAVRSALAEKRHPNYRFWCDGRWKRYG